MNVTVPDEIINEAAMRRQIERALRTKTGPDIRRNFQKTTVRWKNKPSWSQKFTSRTNFLSIAVWASGPNADQYGLVNAGARPHRIAARSGGFLRFKPGYRSATLPGKLTTRVAHRSGRTISARAVNHPGFEARRFDETVAEAVAPQFAKDIDEAVKAGARV